MEIVNKLSNAISSEEIYNYGKFDTIINWISDIMSNWENFSSKNKIKSIVITSISILVSTEELNDAQINKILDIIRYLPSDYTYEEFENISFMTLLSIEKSKRFEFMKFLSERSFINRAQREEFISNSQFILDS